MTRPEQHPYISFKFDVGALSSRTWLKLGEAMSKCQHLAGVPLKPERAEEMASIFLARGVLATTAIEGNTLSEAEVQAIVDRGSAEVGKSREYLEREVQNVLAAIRDIDQALRAGKTLRITRERLEALNRQILEGIPDSPEVVPGKVRNHNVAAGRYRAPDHHEVPELLDQFVRWLNELRASAGPGSADEEKFVIAIISAILAHLYIAWIHPFGNGNGRLARLIEVQILSESGVVPIVATNLLSDFYNKTRDGYYRALDSAQSDVRTFVDYALAGFLDEVRAQIETVKAENIQIHWESHVYETFKAQPSTTTRTRQRDLVLAMPSGAWMTSKEATQLTPALAGQYALCGERTPTRDLNDLEKMRLVDRNKRRYRARRSVIEAFIPPTWEAPHTVSADDALADAAPEDEPTLFDE
ncbi:Fic family protein [Tsukamurella pseudospumae]|uniref:Fido domain-containing protein n=1 Tax=Tsukamurella pseudospumae TaxID=239498 RepID=A0A137ZHU4_9ACTN|nr:Fic family protein [Tsukamurella pseudospumae]KXO97756.1 hypothetical protein AXK61_21275 [Tsukamurella pseudospumae]